MKELTRFPELENVILIEENFTPEYKEIQSWLKSYFSSTKLVIKNMICVNTKELNCISFDDISHTDKDRFKRQICPVYRLENSNRALVKVNRGSNNSHLIIQEINDSSFTYFSIWNDNGLSIENEGSFCDIGTFNLKYTEYEIVYCIIKKLAKNRLFEDIEEFGIEYNFYMKIFDGTEKDFLKCLLYPDELNGYTLHPHDYNEIWNYSDLKTHLFQIKNGKIALSITEQQNLKEKSKNANEVITEINNAFFRLERFMEGNIDYYNYFGFNDAFTLLFSEVKKPKNYTIENCELIDKYWYLIQQISFDFDKSEFDNTDAYDNEAFCKDCNEMNMLIDRVEEFIYFGEEEVEPKVSINDIIKNNSLSKNGTLKVPPATEQRTNIKEFDNTTLTQIINMSDSFLENEERLKNDGFITTENKWINGRGKNQTKTLKDLANLILLLKEKNYLKPKLDRKQLKDSDYKKFFEVRYGCNLKEQFTNAQKDTKKSLETAKITFHYF